MFHITLITLFAGPISDAFVNGTKDHNCSELSQLRLGGLLLHDADLDETEPQWRCRTTNSSCILNISSETVDVLAKCERLRRVNEPSSLLDVRRYTGAPNDSPGFYWKTFIVGAAAGAGFMFIIMTVIVACCCAKKRKPYHLDESEEVESKHAGTSIPTSISVGNGTTQPRCENDSNDSNHAVIEVYDATESDYLTPVDSQSNTEHENDAHQKTNEATVYHHPVNKARHKLPKSTTAANGGDAPVDSQNNIENKNDAQPKRNEAAIYNQSIKNWIPTPPKSTTTEYGGDKSNTPAPEESEKSVFQTRNSGKDRYQELKYPIYENRAKDKRIYMSLLKDNNQNDDQSRMRAPSVVAYVNLPKRSPLLLRKTQQ